MVGGGLAAPQWGIKWGQGPQKEQPHFGEGGNGGALGSPAGRGVMLGLIWAQDRQFQLKFLAGLWGWCLLIALTEQRDFFLSGLGQHLPRHRNSPTGRLGEAE